MIVLSDNEMIHLGLLRVLELPKLNARGIVSDQPTVTVLHVCTRCYKVKKQKGK